MSTTDPGQDPTLAPTDPAPPATGPASQIENAQADQAAVPAVPAPAPAAPASDTPTWSTDAAAPAAPAPAAPDPTPAPAASASDSTPTPAVSSPAPSSPSDSSGSSVPATPAPAAPASSSSEADQLAHFEDLVSKMQAELADLQSKVSSGQLTTSQADDEIATRVAELRQDFENWPQPGDTRPQPWDLKAHDVPQPGVSRDYLPGGQPDELSPIVITHNKPILIPGTAGSAVEELAGLLALAGYSTSISQGRNHTYAFDDTVTAAVSQFKKDFGVKPDPSQFPADSSIASIVVDPWIWEALLRVAGR